MILSMGSFIFVVLNQTQKCCSVLQKDFLQEGMGRNVLKISKFENLSEWILHGTTNNSIQQTLDRSGLILYNNIDKSNVSSQILKQTIYVNQTAYTPIVISLWSKADLVMNRTEDSDPTLLWDKLSLYADLEMQTGKKRWGHSRILSMLPYWQKNELKLDFVDAAIKTIDLFIMFKIPGKLYVRDLLVTETPVVPVSDVNTTIALHHVPFSCVNMQEELTPTPLLVSAAIFNWKRIADVIALVCSLLHYPFLTEIIVWNNNRSFSLQLQHFIDYNDNFTTERFKAQTMTLMDKIRIINSPNNVHDLGRWIACSQAQNSICYIQDDDHEHCFINSLYANLQLYPHLVHSIAPPSINLEQRRWMLWDPRISLHASFSWLGAGSFVPRRLAQHFLVQLSRFPFEGQQLLHVDMLFSLWNNDPAYNLIVPLKQLPSGEAGFRDTNDHRRTPFRTTDRAARTLHRGLARNPFTTLFNRKQSIPLYDDRPAKTICHDDKCLLITNHQMFVPLSTSVIYNASASIREQDQYYLFPTQEWFEQFNYHNAVDGSMSTMWQIVGNHTKSTFYFGLDLLRVHTCQSIRISTTNATRSMLKIKEIFTSILGKEWKRIPVKSVLLNTEHSWRTFEIYPPSENSYNVSFRFFRIRLNKPTFPLFINDIEPVCSPIARSKLLIQRKQRPMVTAIFISWTRLNVWSTIFSHISKYDFINEIIFWNNNPNVTFNHTTLSSYFVDHEIDISLKIINSNSNLYFFARYVACGMAKNTICWFQDDDWLTEQLNALYHNYLQYPHLLHTYTNPYVHYLCWTWSYMDATVSMHTNFNWVGTGGLVSKQTVANFIEKVGKLLASDENIFADMFFSTWLNDHPYQMSTGLNEISNASGFSSVSSGRLRNKYYIWKGANILYEHLRSDASTMFSREETQPLWEDRNVRSPCAADNCLFISNMNAFPSSRYITTNFSLDFDGRASQFANILPKEQLDDWLTYPYHHAVDRSAATCYFVRNSSTNHYFGLDLYSVQFVKSIYIRYEGVKSATDWLNQFIIERIVDRDASQWITVSRFKQIHVDEFWTIISFPELLPIEMVRLKCMALSCNDYKICHLSIINDFNIMLL